MNNIPFFSIIIPVFNMEKTLERCVDSVLKQSCKDWEIILVNDGSIDKSGVISKSFSENHENIHYYFQENKGVSSARNLGIEKSNAEWMIFLDADDYWDDNYLQKIFECTKSNCDIVITGITKILENRNKIKILFDKIGFFSIDDLLVDFMSVQLNSGIYGFVSNKIIKTSIVKKNQLKFNNRIKLCEDLDFFTRYFLNCNTVFITTESGNFYNYIDKKNEVDYISLIKVFYNVKEMLIVKKAMSFENKKLLNYQFSSLKYAYFNELKKINDDDILKGFLFFQNVKLENEKNVNKKAIKILIENERLQLLKIYLKIRLIYMKIRRRWM
jgi:glycosyltransferase involved in cell wall biosynthesis